MTTLPPPGLVPPAPTEPSTGPADGDVTAATVVVFGAFCLGLQLVSLTVLPVLGLGDGAGVVYLMGVLAWAVYVNAWWQGPRMGVAGEVFKAAVLATVPTAPALVALGLVAYSFGGGLGAGPLPFSRWSGLSVGVTTYCCLVMLALLVQGLRHRGRS